MNDFQKSAQDLRNAIGLGSEPVAIFLLRPGDDLGPFREWRALTRHRYCQAVMRARRGERVLLDGEELACPAAASVFGFRPLPEPLAQGPGLVGFGIVAAPEIGRAMFAAMPRLPAGSVASIALCPAADAPRVPEVVVVEGQPEALMWIALADVNRAGGERATASTAVLQAVCADSTVIPLTEKRLNFGLGCYGCREATDLGPEETALGFPGQHLRELARAVTYLAEKAVPHSRSKTAYQRLMKGIET